MKTPMQEHIEWMQEKLRILIEYKDLDAGAEVDECIQHAEAMLKKEKEAVCEFAERYLDSIPKEHPSIEDVYNETFNTKEK